MNHPVKIVPGDSPVILAMPHGGTYVPDDIMTKLNPVGRTLADTDWHIPQLYENILPGTSRVIANFHRYVIDANRDPSGASLYPGQNTTGLCPLKTFDDQAIYIEGYEPSAAEITARQVGYHAPYHQALETEIARIKALHGTAILFDCHSIRSPLPFLFDGDLPDLNIGTFSGASCAPEYEKRAADICAVSDFSHVLNGRFKGGWTTRHYGQPQDGIHAVQLEISQSTYMATSAPWTFRPDKAEALRAVLTEILMGLDALASTQKRT